MGCNVRFKITGKKLWIGIGIITIVLLLALFVVLKLTILHGGAPSNLPAGEMKKPPLGGGSKESGVTPVSVMEVTTGDIRSTLFYTGELHAEDEVEVYSVAPGKVIKYNFNEGDPIRKGEILVRLERQEIWDEYMPLNVRSPISGIVARNYLDAGELAAEQTPLSLILGNKRIKAVINIPEVEMGSVKVGMKARLNVPSLPDHTFDGEISEVSPVLDANTRTSRAEVLFENDDAALVSGMYGDILLVTEEKTEVTTIPSKAILFESGRNGPYCFVIEEDKAKKRPLDLGIVNEDEVEVISGTKPGEIVVIGGKENLSDGSVVIVTDTQ